jgi:pyruvate formate-lyase/glycerol dehydratase family glycyl radical enzyme
MMNERLTQLRTHAMTTPEAIDTAAQDAIWVETVARTAGEPDVIRAAKAWAHYRRHRAIVIHPGELIVGSRAVTHYTPETDVPADEGGYEYPISPPLAQAYLDAGMIITCGNHQTIDYETVMQVGFAGLIDRIDRRLAEIGNDDPKKRDFLAALRITAESHIDFCRRYADLADQQATHCNDPTRQDELKTIAANCRHVAEHPPKTFWQACQAAWFAFMLVPDSAGRLDQYLYPFYRHDLDAGLLTQDDVRELLSCLWMKYQGWLGSTEQRTGNHRVTLGGTHADGTDATNELSWLCLEITETLNISRPQVGVRWHEAMDPAFLARGVKVQQAGVNTVEFCSDEQIIPALMHVGVAQEDARNFSLSGCHEVIVTGKSQMGAVEGMVNLPKMIRIALGLEPELRDDVDLTRLDSYEALWNAVIDAMAQTVAAMHEHSEYLDRLRAGEAGGGLASSLLTQDCIERARCVTAGGATYNFCNWDAIGIANLADSLAAVRRLVFDQQRLTLAELVDAIRNDWTGYEALRAEILAGDEHFGNDNDAIDAIAAEIIRTLDGLLKTKAPYRGGQYILGTLAGYENAHSWFGKLTGATPDGRRAGESFASSLAAAAGRDHRGPTAMLNSVAKMPHYLLPTSTVTNLSLADGILKNQAGIEQVANLIEGHFRSGGQQCQLTFHGHEELLAARAEPEKHGHVMVRVAGYSAPFVALDELTQDEIIARTAHEL